jgi:hypothetical protein
LVLAAKAQPAERQCEAARKSGDPSAGCGATSEAQPGPSRNPPWSREELILALDFYLRFQGAPAAKDSPEIAELSAFLGRMGRSLGLTQADTLRNANRR